MFCQNLISHILLKHFIRHSITITIGQKLEGIHLGCPGRGLLFLFSDSKLELEFSQWPHKCSSSWHVVPVSFRRIGHWTVVKWLCLWSWLTSVRLRVRVQRSPSHDDSCFTFWTQKGVRWGCLATDSHRNWIFKFKQLLSLFRFNESIGKNTLFYIFSR